MSELLHHAALMCSVSYLPATRLSFSRKSTDGRKPIMMGKLPGLPHTFFIQWKMVQPRAVHLPTAKQTQRKPSSQLNHPVHLMATTLFWTPVMAEKTLVPLVTETLLKKRTP